MARMASTNTRLTPYPHVRVPPSVTYASSDTTLAESYPVSPASPASPCSPRSQRSSSSRNCPPPYIDGAAPPSYEQETCAGGKSRSQPLPKKILIIRLFTSIFIAVIVCLIVAAVVGRIHDTQAARDAQTQQHQKEEELKNGTRITIMPEKDPHPATSTPMPSTTVSLSSSPSSTPSSSSTSSRTKTMSTAEQIKIARPAAHQVASYSCPYIHPAAKTASAAGPTASPSGSRTCGLLKPLAKEDEAESSSEGSILSVSLHSLDGCVIARETYLGSRNEIMYRCGLSCSADSSGSDDAVSGLQDGWKWQCS